MALPLPVDGNYFAHSYCLDVFVKMRRRLGDDRRNSFALRRSAPERSERKDRSAFCLSREMMGSQAISLREIEERREGER